jgi:hypothetical protein
LSSCTKKKEERKRKKERKKEKGKKKNSDSPISTAGQVLQSNRWMWKWGKRRIASSAQRHAKGPTDQKTI